MRDPAHALADKELEEIEKRIEEIYKRANKEIEEKAQKYFKRFAELDKGKRALVESGKMTEEAYQKWKQGKIMTGKHWETLKLQTAERMNQANNVAAEYANKRLPSVYASNYNRIASGINDQVQGRVNFELVNENTVRNLATQDKTLLPYKTVNGVKDVRWNTQKVNSEILQGILQGDSVADLSKRLRHVTEMNRASSVRNARTSVTSAENKGRIDMLHDAEDAGVRTKKVWLSVHDKRTRDAHLALSGVEADPDEPFEIFGMKIMYPGDPDAEPEMVYNCRCTLTYRVLGFYNTGNGGKEDAFGDRSMGDLVEPQRPWKRDYDDMDEFEKDLADYRIASAEYDERMNNIIENVLNDENHYSEQEILEWANSVGINISDDLFDKIDYRIVSEARPVLDEMITRFPEVKSYELELFDGSKFRTSFNIGVTDTGLMSAGSGISFNPRDFSAENSGSGLRWSLNQITNGFNVRGDGTFGTLIRHEYGHNVQEYIERNMAQKYHYFVDDWRKNFKSFDEFEKARSNYLEEKKRYDKDLLSLVGLSGSSEYSNTNEYELFAEGFAEWSSNGKSEFAKAFGEFLGRWY